MPNGSTRDTQKRKLYTAEAVLDSFSKRVDTVPEIADYVDKSLSRATIQRRYARQLTQPIRVHDGRGRRIAVGGYHYVKLPDWTRKEHIILHEIAHTICQRMHGNAVAAHGWQYAGIYLDLVQFCMGAQAGAALKASFKTNRVRFRPKKGSAESAIHQQRMRSRKAIVLPKKTAVVTIDDLRDPAKLKALKAQLTARKKIAVPAPHLVPKPKAKKAVDKNYAAFRALAREGGFTYEIERDSPEISYIQTTAFGPFPEGWSTMHHGWSETLDRLRTCLKDPSLVEGGHYSE